ncbi:MAG: phosphate uptake regulator PhoU [Candidatus Bathyarchaeota archaeon]
MYIISLPKDWVREMNIKPGDPLTISKGENMSLTISPKGLGITGGVSEAELLISPKDDVDSIARKIIALYLVGYKTIRIFTKGEPIIPACRAAIKEIVKKKFVGTEVVSDSSKEITLQVLLSFPELSVSSSLRRMWTITTSMHKDILLALKDLDYELAQTVIELDDEIDRFELHIIRQLKTAVMNPRILSEIGLKTPRDSLGFRVVTKSVERIADNAANIAEIVLRLKSPLEPKLFNKISDLSNFANSVFEGSIKSLLERNYGLADYVIAKGKIITVSMENEFLKLVSKGYNPEAILNSRLILESVKRMAEYTTDITEVVLNLTVEKASSSKNSHDGGKRFVGNKNKY